MFWSPTTRRISRWLILFIVVLGAAHLILHMYQQELEERFGRHYSRWLDMNVESSVATWFSVGLLQVVAALAVVAAVAAATRRQRIAWLRLPLRFFY